MGRWEIESVPVLHTDTLEEKLFLKKMFLNETSRIVEFLIENSFEASKGFSYEIVKSNNQIRFMYNVNISDAAMADFSKGLTYVKLIKTDYSKDFKYGCSSLFEKKLYYSYIGETYMYAGGGVPQIMVPGKYGMCGQKDAIYKVPVCRKVNNDMMCMDMMWVGVAESLNRLERDGKLVINVNSYNIDELKDYVPFFQCCSQVESKEELYSSILRGRLLHKINIGFYSDDDNSEYMNTFLNSLMSDLKTGSIVRKDSAIQIREKNTATYYDNDTMIKDFVEKVLLYTYDEEEVTSLLMPPFTFTDNISGARCEVYKPFVVPKSSKDVYISENNLKGCVQLGHIRHGKKVFEAIDAFTRHTLIAGATGTGKSTQMKQIISNLPADVPLLIVDPVKDEYEKFLLELSSKGLRNKPFVIRSQYSDEYSTGFYQFNPFVCPDNVTLNAHISFLEKVFITLVQSDEASIYDYVRGMINSTYKRHIYTFYEKYLAMANHKMNYSVEEFYNRCLLEKGFYAAVSRDYIKLDQNTKKQLACPIPVIYTFKKCGLEWIDMLTKGKKDRNSLQISSYFSRWWLRLAEAYPCFYNMCSLYEVDKYYDFLDMVDKRDIVILLDQIRDEAEKKALFTYFVGLLDEYRRGNKSNGGKLRHMTILEEAHNIASSEGTSVAAVKCAELLKNMLCEIRAFGEGVVIIEQSPSKLIKDAIVNTGTKIIKRLSSGEDIDMISSAMGMKSSEKKALSYLEINEAVEYLPDIPTPVNMILDK